MISRWTPPDLGEPPDEAARAWYLRLRSGDATRAEAAQLRAWLAADTRHGEAFDRARSLWIGLGALYAEPLALEPHRARRRVRRRLAVASAMVGTAVAAIVVTPSIHWLFADRHTSVGQVQRAELPDGTVAWLDSGSAIDLDFGAHARRVRLVQGRVWVDVAHDPGRPFSIVSGAATLTDVGTAFQARQDGEATQVEVASGRVDVALDGHVTHLSAGQGGRFAAAQDSVLAAVGSDAGAWRQGRLAFDGQPLSAVLQAVGRYRWGRVILLGDAAVGARPVTAIFRLDDLDAGLDALAQSQRLRLYRAPGLIFIRPR